jgi:hypothetical protein
MTELEDVLNEFVAHGYDFNIAFLNGEYVFYYCHKSWPTDLYNSVPLPTFKRDNLHALLRLICQFTFEDPT